ncbi:uncharacterized protein LOC101453479 isoform X3 [Ceratitis capitata]|uniref:uncharacterized protein LOC101453479 isoform X3 n=2 Tax=Ceratitis capitata TaxID=7213 RepID=UPI000C6C838E|nr:uncharacterized protein LOC101453479 isoform X3 [Ceratitis capitata]XP_023158293.1 uncharacterized protein LOC101453479 isoform X3 [Ceratitis capitata]
MPVHLKPINVHVDTYNRMRHQMQVAEISPYNKCSTLLAGISAVVGVIGGVCLLTSGVKTVINKICEGRVSKKESSNEDICNVCSCQIDLNESKNFVTCYICNKRVCRATKCSNWLPRSDRWECQLCQISKDTLTHTQSWIAEQMSFNRQIFRNTNPMRARSEIFIPIGDYNESSMQFESVSQVGLSSAAITSEQKLKIREYVEEVVEKLLGGSLDQIRVGQLSKSENYLPGIINSHAGAPQALAGRNSNQSNENVSPEVPEISQTRLRQMIELIIAETLRSPEIALNTHASSNELSQTVSKSSRNGDVRQSGTTERYFEPRIYQELLATAVLNRIADKEGNFRQFSESTPDLSLSNINGNIDVQDRSISSTSSAEPRSDFSYTDTEQSPKISKVSGRESILNEYIASHTVPLPDFSTAVTESEEDDHDSISSSVMADGNWEDNWLFKKKSSSLTTSMTGSVGMLVPAPKDDVRAQIGDKTADEISDLSEMGSDTDDSSAKPDEDLNPLNDRILNKHLIGGQNTGVILDELMETASLISTTSHSQDEPKFTEATNERIINIALKYESVDTKADAKYNDPKPEPVCDSLSAPMQSNDEIEDESDCLGISSVEMFELNPSGHETRSISQGPSVIEILAAVALGPMLAVPATATDQRSILTSAELNSLRELSELALIEIKSRTSDLEHRSLDVIDEEEEAKMENLMEIIHNPENQCLLSATDELADITESIITAQTADDIQKQENTKITQPSRDEISLRHQGKSLSSENDQQKEEHGIVNKAQGRHEIPQIPENVQQRPNPLEEENLNKAEANIKPAQELTQKEQPPSAENHEIGLSQAGTETSNNKPPLSESENSPNKPKEGAAIESKEPAEDKPVIEIIASKLKEESLQINEKELTVETIPQPTTENEQQKANRDADEEPAIRSESQLTQETLQTNETEQLPSPHYGKEIEKSELSKIENSCSKGEKGAAIELKDSVQLAAQVHQENLLVSENEQEKQLIETKQKSTTEPQVAVEDEQEKQGSEAVVVVKAESDLRPEALPTHQTKLSLNPAEVNEVESNETSLPLPENTEQLSEGENSCSKEQEKSALELEESVPLQAQVHQENLIVSEIGQEKQQNETNEESTTEPQATVEDDQEKQGSEAVVVFKADSDLRPEALQTNQTELSPSPAEGNEVESNETALPLPENTEQLSEGENSCSKEQEKSALELEESVPLPAQVHQENLIVSEIGQEKQQNETNEESTTEPQATVEDDQEKQVSEAVVVVKADSDVRPEALQTNQTGLSPSPAEGNEVDSNETASPLPENTEQLPEGENSCSKEQEESALELEESVQLTAQVHQENLIVSEIEQEKQQNETNQESTTEPQATVGDEQEKQGSEAVVVVKAESDVRPEALQTNQTELSPSPAEGNEVESNETASPLPENTEQLSEGENSCNKEQEESTIKLEESVKLPIEVHQEKLIVSEIEQEKQQNETKQESTTEPQPTVGDEQKKQGSEALVVVKAESDERPEALPTNQTELSPSPAKVNEVDSNETALPLPENTEQLPEGESSCSKEQEGSAIELEESVPLTAQVHQENLLVSKIEQEKEIIETKQESTTESHANIENGQQEHDGDTSAEVVSRAESVSPVSENTEQLVENENSCSMTQEGSVTGSGETVQIETPGHQANNLVCEIDHSTVGNEHQQPACELEAVIKTESQLTKDTIQTIEKQQWSLPAEDKDIENIKTYPPVSENSAHLSEGENSCSSTAAGFIIKPEETVQLETHVQPKPRVQEANSIVSKIDQENHPTTTEVASPAESPISLKNEKQNAACEPEEEPTIEIKSPLEFNDIVKNKQLSSYSQGMVLPSETCETLVGNVTSGSIAEREHKKWNNAVEMPNNPYTTEALQRRISGSQERIIDLPNISGTTERNPISIATKEPEAVTGNEIRNDIDYKRYSRDYYINDDNVAKTSPKHQIAAGDEGITDKLATVDVTNEVNYNGKNTNKGIPFSDHNDCHWILSTPVRRSSSLKIINRRSPPKSYSNFRANATPTSPKYYQKHYLPQRSYSSMSHYDNLDRIHLQDNQRNAIARHSDCYRGNKKCGACEDGLIVNIDGNTGNVDLDIYNDLNDYSDHRHSERAWRSASANSYYPTTLPARHTPSSLSFNSSASGTSVRSSKSKHSSSHNINTLSQFEKQLLHKDLKRNSFRAISATSKEFVMNPLYELENINGTSDGSENTNSQGKTKRTNKHSRDEQIDSGVDSFLNGFNEIEVKVNDTTTNLPI